MKLILMLVTTLAFVACSPSPKTPEGLLKMFVKDVSTKELSKDYFLKYTTGKLKEDIEALDEDEIGKRKVFQAIKGAKTKILTQNCQQNTCSITYVVTYDNVEGDKTTFQTETKKIAQFKKDEDGWKISEVTHLKTFHESTEPINALEEN